MSKPGMWQTTATNTSLACDLFLPHLQAKNDFYIFKGLQKETDYISRGLCVVYKGEILLSESLHKKLAVRCSKHSFKAREVM